MNSEEITYFNQLKAEVIAIFVQNNSVNSPNCNDWTGQEIELFKEDFIQKVKSGFSEKWFYTYFKNDAQKLPRIDMLNLLSAYAGYQNFADFKAQHQPEKTAFQKKSSHSNAKKFWLAGGILLALCGLSYVVFGWIEPSQKTFSFCFIEKSNQLPPQTPLRITLLLKNESPLEMSTDEHACFDYTTTSDQIKFVVQSPFHEADTIVRNIKVENHETIPLRSNDYALMLQYYASDNVQDWRRKRERLNHIIAENSTIYRVYPQNGIAIYNKKEFINQLTIPTEALKKIKILEIDYQQNQIVKLKFMVTE